MNEHLGFELEFFLIHLKQIDSNNLLVLLKGLDKEKTNSDFFEIPKNDPSLTRF